MIKSLDPVFFVSDIHLGLRIDGVKEREMKFYNFLKSLPEDTAALYLLGDIFDFWYEYKFVIPSGHTRVLGKLAELVDRGVEVVFVNGNHDIWTYRFLQDEIGLKVFSKPIEVDICGSIFYLGHGDGLGYSSFGYKFLQFLFKNRIIQVLFSSLHPRWAFGLGYAWSKHTRLAKVQSDNKYVFRGEVEPIYKYANSIGQRKKIDYFIFGHFHSPYRAVLPSGAELIILGEWINNFDYLVFEGDKIERRIFG